MLLISLVGTLPLQDAYQGHKVLQRSTLLGDLEHELIFFLYLIIPISFLRKSALLDKLEQEHTFFMFDDREQGLREMGLAQES